MTTAAKTHKLEDLPTPFLKCRVFGHAWDEYIPAGSPKPSFGWLLASICVSCGTERRDIVGVGGMVVSREYRYPAGYSLSFALTRGEAREEYRSRSDRRTARRGQLRRLV